MPENQSGGGLEVYSLFSGSKGNCFFIRSSEDEILIDAGASARATDGALRELGSSLDRIKAIFITHEHSDHTSGLRVISKKHSIPIHIAERCAKEMAVPSDSPMYCNLVLHEPIYSANVGRLRIQSFVTPHDSVLCLGYVIDLGGEAEIGIATDIGNVTDTVYENLCGCKNVILESNHDREMLMSGGYPYELKMRIDSRYGHLSNDECAKTLSRLADNGARKFMLAHLSAENNTPDIALHTVEDALKRAGRSAECTVVVASQNTVTRLV